jgi:cellulose synthase/poly-beta-1,6-N-acetylglucosamine synthase-like glycosyltransferase
VFLILLILCFCLTLIYGVFILRLWSVYHKAQTLDIKKEYQPEITIIVPFRNEQVALKNLIPTLCNQDYPLEQFEVVFVDDQSTDGSTDVARSLLEKSRLNHKILLNPGKGGKKESLRLAVEQANAEIILQTDADCILPSNWIEESVKPFYKQDTKAAIGLVDMTPTLTWQSNYIALEFLSLQASGIAMAYMGLPVMSNGANLAFRKSEWLHHQTHNLNWASGDDVFFIQQLAVNESRAVAVNERSKVQTAAPDTFMAFLKQRVRWGGKTFDYPLKQAKYIAYLVAALNLFLVIVLLVALYREDISLSWWFVLMALKAMPDYLLLKAFTKRNQLKGALIYFLPTTLMYPVYIVLSGFIIVFAPTLFKWKGRKVKR